jgi:hypothetical protein
MLTALIKMSKRNLCVQLASLSEAFAGPYNCNQGLPASVDPYFFATVH